MGTGVGSDGRDVLLSWIRPRLGLGMSYVSQMVVEELVPVPIHLS